MKLVREIENGSKLNEPEQVIAYLKEFNQEDREYFIVIGLDARLVPMYREITAIGALNQTVVRAREIFKRAIIASAASVIIAHNHPSGDTSPSDTDIKCVQELIKAGKLLGIPVLDSIIIGKSGYYSWKQENNIPEPGL